MFFDSWYGLLRVIVVGTFAYAALIALLRVSGKRSLSKMNAFDLVVTVALGSTFAAVILNNSIPLAEGVLALVLLVCLQFMITWLSVRFRAVEDLVKSEPSLLARDGAYLTDAMREQRVTKKEIEAALRENGTSDITKADCVVLETDGSLSVIQSGKSGSSNDKL
jgi:uncharacterized membrane protein YcaP (DUF421 family)